MTLRPAEIEKWSVEEVAQWMKGEGFSKSLINTFRYEEIDGEALMLIDCRNLFRIGIKLATANLVMAKRNQLQGRSGWENYHRSGSSSLGPIGSPIPVDRSTNDQHSREKLPLLQSQPQILNDNTNTNTNNEPDTQLDNEALDKHRQRSMNLFSAIKGGADTPKYTPTSDPDEISSVTQPVVSEISNFLKSKFNDHHYFIPCSQNFLFLNPNTNVDERKIVHCTSQIYHKMMTRGTNQVIVTRGASGSGKTYCTTRMLQALTSKFGPSTPSSLQEAHVRAAINIFESFLFVYSPAGLALQSGVEIDIFYSRLGAPVGLQFETIAFPKSYVSVLEQPNFSVFYQLLFGITATERTELALVQVDPSRYPYTACKYIHDWHGPEQETSWKTLTSSLKLLGFSREELRDIRAVLAAILHLSRTNFLKNPAPSLDNPYYYVPSNMLAIDLVCKLLNWDPKQLVSALVAPESENSLLHGPAAIRRRGTIADVRIPQDERGAMQTRDDLAAFLYSQVVVFILSKLNRFFGEEVPKAPFSISLVDFPGIDSHNPDSLYSLFHNYTNEVLHQQYLREQIKEKEKNFLKANLKWQRTPYEDNLEIIQIFDQAKVGLFDVLNESCFFDKKLNLEKITAPLFTLGESEFTIRHYSGDVVSYKIEKMQEKNLGAQRPDFFKLMRGLKVIAFSHFFQQKKLVGDVVQGQIERLMNKIEASSVWNLLCLQTNPKNLKSNFDLSYVGKQLVAFQLPAVVRIKKDGFFEHFDTYTFFQRYNVISPLTFLWVGTPTRGVLQLLNSLEIPTSHFFVDNNDVFVKDKSVSNFLETNRAKKLAPLVVKIQAVVRGFLVRKERPQSVLNKKRSVKLIENFWLQFCGRKWSEHVKEHLTMRKISYPKMSVNLPQGLEKRIETSYRVAVAKSLIRPVLANPDVEVELRQKVLAYEMFTGRKLWKCQPRWENDYLEKDNLSNRSKLISYLQTLFIANKDKQLIYAGFGFKVNNKGKSQKRAFICTERHIYKTDPKTFKIMKEATPLTAIKSVSISPYKDGFLVIRCKTPWRDILVDMGTGFAEFVATLGFELATRRQTNLPVHIMTSLIFNNSRTEKKGGMEESFTLQELPKTDKIFKGAESNAVFVKGNKGPNVVYFYDPDK